MKRFFNTTGACDPQLHYMVDIHNRLEEIKTYVDAGEYFTINRARQYGKTTTLMGLAEYLVPDYVVLSLDFQKIGHEEFQNGTIFAKAFVRYLLRTVRNRNHPVNGLRDDILQEMETEAKTDPAFSMGRLFEYLSDLCGASEKPVVLIIDEVDSATNNQVFLDFLAQLRGYYLTRRTTPTFQSVILAGVYDVRNIKRKLRPEDEHKINSPWNIAADFDVAMSLSEEGIAGMLREYETDHHTGMNVEELAGLLYDYTSGYPFLVSRICKLLDEVVCKSTLYPSPEASWTKGGFLEAVKLLLNEKNTLFESMTGKIQEYTELHQILYFLLFRGSRTFYNLLDPSIEIAELFGFIKNENGTVVISNRIFETVLYNFFLTKEAVNNETSLAAFQDKNQFVQDGRLNMELVLEKFAQHFDDVYGDQDQKFLEEEGRRYFLLYLRPIINGTGNYYIESRTRNMERTDVIVDYRGEQFVCELKIWHGNAYRERGEKQLSAYLDSYHLKKGYMISFNFNEKKEVGVKKILLGDKVLIEAVV